MREATLASMPIFYAFTAGMLAALGMVFLFVAAALPAGLSLGFAVFFVAVAVAVASKPGKPQPGTPETGRPARSAEARGVPSA